MSDAQLDSFPVSLLQERYKIVRSAVYSRLEALNIQPEKRGGKAFVNAEQLKLLDALHGHIKRGGTTSEFVASLSTGQIQKSSGQVDLSSGQPDLTSELVVSSGQLEKSSGQAGQLEVTEQYSALAGLIEALASRLIPTLAAQFVPPRDPLANLRGLEEAYRNEWLLSTSELAQLLKLSNSTVTKYGDCFEDGGFVFTRAGTRKRGEVAWSVTKLRN